MIIHPRIGVGVIILKNRHILLGERTGSFGNGFWSMPGGKLDFGESLATCAIRETMEETGILIENPRYFDHSEDMIENQHYLTMFMIVSLHEDDEQIPYNMEPDKSGPWEWFSIDDKDKWPNPLWDHVDKVMEKLYNL